eukprot:scaffold63634_cov17-Tisochrysis_lutea.AAC.1
MALQGGMCLPVNYWLITITIIMISIIILVVYSETAMTLKSETAMTLKGKKGDGGTLKMPLQGIAAFPSITLYHAHALHEEDRKPGTCMHAYDNKKPVTT